MRDIVIILTTFPTDHDGARIFARTLVEERLAACVAINPPMTSVYTWEGKTEEASEHQLTIKTTAARVPDVIARIEELHPYDIPEILVLPIADGGAAYLAWVTEMTG